MVRHLKTGRMPEQASADANHGLALPGRIPGKTRLRSQVHVGLVYAIFQSAIGIELVGEIEIAEKWNRTQVAVGSSSVAHVAESQRQGERRRCLPGILHVPRDPVVRP